MKKTKLTAIIFLAALPLPANGMNAWGPRASTRQIEGGGAAQDNPSLQEAATRKDSKQPRSGQAQVIVESAGAGAGAGEDAAEYKVPVVSMDTITKQQTAKESWLGGWFGQTNDGDNSELIGSQRWTGPTRGDSSYGIANHTYQRIEHDKAARNSGKVCSPNGLARYNPSDTAPMLALAAENALKRENLPPHERKGPNDHMRTGKDGRFSQLAAFINAANNNKQSFSNRRQLRDALKEQRLSVMASALEEWNRLKDEVESILALEHELDKNTKALTTSRPTTPDSLEHIKSETTFLQYTLSTKDTLPQLLPVE